MSRPPRWAERLIRLLLPREEHDELLGDLHERFRHVLGRGGRLRAAAWYWMQTLRSTPHLLLGRLRAVPRRGRLSSNQGISFAGIGSPFRILRHEPLFSLTTVTVLAIGIGAPTTMYSIVTGLRQGLPLPDAHELVAIARQNPAVGGAAGFDALQFDALRETQSVMAGLAAYRPVGAQIDGWPGAPTRAMAVELSAHAFALLGVDPVLGRLPGGADSEPGALPVVLIGEDHWRDVYDASPGALGSTVRVNGAMRTVIAVLPSWFRFPVDQTVWMPLPANGLEGAQADPGGSLQLFGRLRDEVGLDVARADLQRAAESLAASPQPVEGVVTVRPFQEAFLGRGTVASVLLLVVSFVLVIASANVTTLLLGRALGRRKQIAVRMALGGSRGRIRLQFLSEAAVLAGLGVAFGIAFAWLGVAWFDRFVLAPYVDLWWTDVAVDRQALVFAACCGFAATLIAGVAPAMHASDVHLLDAMRADATGASVGGARGFTGWLVAAQLALSCTLLILTTVLVQAAAVDGGPTAVQDPSAVMTGRLTLGPFDYPDDNTIRAFARELEAELRSIPGVTDVALTTALPGLSAPTTRVALGASEDSMIVQHGAVSASFFDLFPMDFLEGSPPGPGPEAQVVVTEELARRLSPSASAVGLTLEARGLGPARIVGVIRHPERGRASGAPVPLLFRPIERATPRAFHFAIRTTVALAATEIRATLGSIDPNLPLERIESLEDAHREASAIGRRVAGLFTAFGIMAVVITLAGLYGTVLTAARRRRKEIGLRRVLGASTTQLIMAAAARPFARHVAGLVAGIGIAVLLAPALRPVARGKAMFDPVSFVAVPLLLAVVAGVAVLLPSHRAATVDPAVELREE